MVTPQFKLLLMFLLIGAKTTAQTLCNQITADMGYTVHSVKINARWVSPQIQQHVEQIIGLGQSFNPANVAAGETAVKDEIVKNEGQPEWTV